MNTIDRALLAAKTPHPTQEQVASREALQADIEALYAALCGKVPEKVGHQAYRRLMG